MWDAPVSEMRSGAADDERAEGGPGCGSGGDKAGGIGGVVAEGSGAAGTEAAVAVQGDMR